MARIIFRIVYYRLPQRRAFKRKHYAVERDPAWQGKSRRTLRRYEVLCYGASLQVYIPVAGMSRQILHLFKKFTLARVETQYICGE